MLNALLANKHQKGVQLISGAVNAFSEIEADLQEGIESLDASIKEHQAIISESEEHIAECQGHIDRAHRVAAKIRAITE